MSEPGPGVRPTHPRWFIVLLGVGVTLALSALILFLLAALGVDHVNEVGSFLVLVCAGAAGAWVMHLLVPRLPPLGRTPPD